MRKKLFISALLISITALAAAGTWAATAAEGRTTNVITTGGVNIAVNEYQSIDGVLVSYNTEIPVDVMPTRQVSKIVKIENTGESAAWVRVKFAVDISGLPDETEPDERIVMLDVSKNGDWVSREDGWYYYTQKLIKGEETTASLESVTFVGGMGNEYQNSKVVITATAEAVQCANNGKSYEEASGWASFEEGEAR